MGKARILVVEDEAIVAMDLQNKLEDLGYSVPALSYSGEEAIDLAHSLNPDLVLMDIKLNGETDGIQAAEQIRDQLDLPVVYLTAYADDDTLQRAKLTSPFGYLLKPVEQRDLQTAVEVAIYKHGVERKLKASEQWLATVLRSTSDAVAATDENGSISFMNPVAETLMGWPAEDALGKQLADLFNIRYGQSQRPAMNPVGKALRENRVVNLAHDTELFTKDGSSLPINGTAAPIKDDDGNPTGVVLTFRDITDRKRIEEERAAALEKAREADRLKSQLLSTVSHELHTPLAAIKGFATTLLDCGDKLDDAEKHEFLQEIDAASDRLSHLIDHLLQFSRLESGMLPIDPVPTNIVEVVGGAMGHLRIRDPQKQVTFELPDDLPMVMADPRRLRQVLDNLLDNALKYTPAHSSLWIECIRTTENQVPMVRLTVRDDGPGVPEAMSERIFEPFRQAGEPVGLQNNGVGLGLAICRRIIDAHQGRIWAESVEGGGVAFVVTLPLADPGQHRLNHDKRMGQLSG